jgi:hypothetical protein
MGSKGIATKAGKKTYWKFEIGGWKLKIFRSGFPISSFQPPISNKLSTNELT